MTNLVLLFCYLTWKNRPQPSDERQEVNSISQMEPFTSFASLVCLFRTSLSDYSFFGFFVPSTGTITHKHLPGYQKLSRGDSTFPPIAESCLSFSHLGELFLTIWRGARSLVFESNWTVQLNRKVYIVSIFCSSVCENFSWVQIKKKCNQRIKFTFKSPLSEGLIPPRFCFSSVVYRSIIILFY